MSIIVNGYIVSETIQPASPSWYRLERCAYCETLKESAAASKRGLFARKGGKKRGK